MLAGALPARDAWSARDIVAELDLTFRTDNRQGVPGGFCDALVGTLDQRSTPRR